MSSRFTVPASSIIAVLLAISSPAAAQTQLAQPDTSPPAAQEGASAEPAASPGAAEEAESPEEEYVPEDEAAAEEEPAAAQAPAPSKPSAPSTASRKANLGLRDSNRSVRVLTEVILGLAGWTIGGYAGSGIGANFAPRLSYYPMFWATSFGWIVGSSLALPLAVGLAGVSWKSRGEFITAFLPALIGMAAQLGVGVALRLNNETNYSWMPLMELLVGGVGSMVAAIAGYEGSHRNALRSAAPVARPLWIKGGGGVALAWAI